MWKLLQLSSHLIQHRILSLTALLMTLAGSDVEAKEDRQLQYILVNHHAGSGWNREKAEFISEQEFLEVKQAFPEKPGARIRPGIGFIFSYLRGKDEDILGALQHVLNLSEKTGTPVYIQLDGEQWWDARPDLWNWWDPSLPGFNPDNRFNVEWTSWSADDALKIAWRNWGRQLRVRPPPNLMSPRYRSACHEKMKLLVPVVLNWWKQLPEEKKELFAGLKVGWESSIGVNAWHYPGGNALLDQPADKDPTTGLKADDLPSRGVAQIGYAAVHTAGIRTNGAITEADLAEVSRRHLEDLSKLASQLGVPREKLFTHGVGWKEGELNYQSALNDFSCPGWSFYRHAADPKGDVGVQTALKKSNAPYWAATEWLLQVRDDSQRWEKALENTLADRRCRLICIYNWNSIRQNEAALEAIRRTIQKQ